MRMHALVVTIAETVKAVQHFSVVYACCILTFAIAGHALFGGEVAAFSTFGGSISAVWITSLGSVDVYVDDLDARARRAVLLRRAAAHAHLGLLLKVLMRHPQLLRGAGRQDSGTSARPAC